MSTNVVLLVTGVVSRGADCLGNAGPGERAADLGPVTGFIVFVGKITQQCSPVLFVRNARYSRSCIVGVLYQNSVGEVLEMFGDSRYRKYRPRS